MKLFNRKNNVSKLSEKAGKIELTQHNFDGSERTIYVDPYDRTGVVHGEERFDGILIHLTPSEIADQYLKLKWGLAASGSLSRSIWLTVSAETGIEQFMTELKLFSIPPFIDIETSKAHEVNFYYPIKDVPFEIHTGFINTFEDLKEAICYNTYTPVIAGSIEFLYNYAIDSSVGCEFDHRVQHGFLNRGDEPPIAWLATNDINGLLQMMANYSRDSKVYVESFIEKTRQWNPVPETISKDQEIFYPIKSRGLNWLSLPPDTDGQDPVTESAILGLVINHIGENNYPRDSYQFHSFYRINEGLENIFMERFAKIEAIQPLYRSVYTSSYTLIPNDNTATYIEPSDLTLALKNTLGVPTEVKVHLRIGNQLLYPDVLDEERLMKELRQRIKQIGHNDFFVTFADKDEPVHEPKADEPNTIAHLVTHRMFVKNNDNFDDRMEISGHIEVQVKTPLGKYYYTYLPEIEEEEE